MAVGQELMVAPVPVGLFGAVVLLDPDLGRVFLVREVVPLAGHIVVSRYRIRDGPATVERIVLPCCRKRSGVLLGLAAVDPDRLVSLRWVLRYRCRTAGHQFPLREAGGIGCSAFRVVASGQVVFDALMRLGATRGIQVVAAGGRVVVALGAVVLVDVDRAVFRQRLVVPLAIE